MIKLYNPPEEITCPEIGPNTDWKTYDQDCENFVDELRQWCKTHSKNKYAGEIIHFPVADGCAQYMVFKPSVLIHIPTGDAYHFNYIERLTAKDVIEKINQHEAMRKLFNGQPTI